MLSLNQLKYQKDWPEMMMKDIQEFMNFYLNAIILLNLIFLLINKV